MKTYFFPVKSKIRITLPEKLIKTLPNEIEVYTTIQYHHELNNIIEQLKKHNKKAILTRPKHTAKEGQILGCSKINTNKPALFIGDGEFHKQAIQQTKKEVYTYNPKTKEWKKENTDWKEKEEKKKNAAMKKFLHSKIIGVLITTKPGQNRINLARKLKEKYPEKKFIMIIADDINPEKLEDFNFIEAYVNTACPRIAIDERAKFQKPIINIQELDFEW